MLIVRHKRQFLEPRLPHTLFLDGLYAGTLTGDELRLDAPPGTYRLRVQLGECEF